MRRAALIVVCAALATPGIAEAKDMVGRFGVGADSTLGFTGGPAGALSGDLFDRPAMSIVYRATKLFGLQLLLATELVSGPGDVSERETDVAVRGMYRAAFHQNVELQAVVGLGLDNESSSLGGMDTSATNFQLDLGLRPEWFVTDHLSLHVQVGIAFSILDEDTPGFSEGGVHVNIFGAADLLGTAGFTFWF